MPFQVLACAVWPGATNEPAPVMVARKCHASSTARVEKHLEPAGC